METLEARLEKFEQKLNRKEDASKEKDELAALRQELNGLDEQAVADFAKIGKHLQDKNLPAVILKRHQDAVTNYQQEMATLKANLDDVDRAKSDDERGVTARKAKDHLKAKQKKRGPKTKFDPNDLPNKSLQPNRKNTPKLKKEEFTRAGFQSNPVVQLAALGDFIFDKLPGASDPAYLAATVEVTLTDAIKAKATELQYDPVKIYLWVRNNVEWLPTWGATQDADVTLGSRRGNAFDIASLLIALYRASGIPARYVHGAIEVPADKFMNWAGGFSNIEAAANFISSGGIPIATVVSGGRITKVQLEHIWVEAAIDFYPARGAINKSADRWVQLDASFKQYEHVAGLDIVAMSGLDPNAVVQSFTSSGTHNQQEGWVTGLNSTIMENAQAQARAALEAYVTDNPNATIADVIGARKILAQVASVLPAALPYRSLVVGARYGTLPAPLQHFMTFAFGIDFLGEPVNPVVFPWPRLNNHKVTLSFRPATAADEQALISMVPGDGSQLPANIPSYLIFVIPQLAIDGQIVGSGNAMHLGETLKFFYGIDRVNGQGSHSYTYDVIAGSYLSVAVAGGSISGSVLQNLRTKIQDTEAKIKSGNAGVIGALTSDEILGDMFQAGTLGYFGQYLALSHMTSQSQKTRHGLPFAYGTFGYEPNVQTLFGLPRAITPGSIAVNVRLSWIIQSANGDMTKLRDFNLHSGILSSALEHAVPEQMFSLPTQPVQGVSAARALQMAASQGQRIYHITQANQAQALPNLHLDSLAMSEITQALAVGKEVIAHTDRISIPGWMGEGYILFDPATGAGAYKITGGANGGDVPLGAIANAAASLTLIALLAGKLALAGLIAPFLIPVGYYVLAFALIAFTIFIYMAIVDGIIAASTDINTCSGQPNVCKAIDLFTLLAGLSTVIALLAAGLSGNILALVLGILLLKQMLGGRF